MVEVGYNVAELARLRYVKLTYSGVDGNPHEIKTELKTLSDAAISLYVRCRTYPEIQCPQQIIIKFITDNGLFEAISVLQRIEKVDNIVYFLIQPPTKMIKCQNRKYYRVNMKRTCVLVATDENAHSTAYMSRLVDVSAGGILIYKLESMFDNEFIAIEPENYKQFNIVLFLDIDVVLKLSARYVRQEKHDKFYRYAFEFTNMKQSDIDIISKYVTKEQVEQLKMQNKVMV